MLPKTTKLISVIIVTFISLLLISCRDKFPISSTLQPSQKIIFEAIYEASSLSLVYGPSSNAPIPFRGFFINEIGEVYSFRQSNIQKKSGDLYSKNDIYQRYGNDISNHKNIPEAQLNILKEAGLNINVDQFIEEGIAVDSGLLTYTIYFSTEENEFLYKSVKVYEDCDNFYLNTSPETFDIISTLDMLILDYEFDSILRPFCGEDLTFDKSIFEQMLNYR